MSFRDPRSSALNALPALPKAIARVWRGAGCAPMHGVILGRIIHMNHENAKGTKKTGEE